MSAFLIALQSISISITFHDTLRRKLSLLISMLTVLMLVRGLGFWGGHWDSE